MAQEQMSAELLAALQKIMGKGKAPAFSAADETTIMPDQSEILGISGSSGVKSYSNTPVEQYTPDKKYKQPQQAVNPPQPKISYNPGNDDISSQLKDVLLKAKNRRSEDTSPNQSAAEAPAKQYNQNLSASINKIKDEPIAEPQEAEQETLMPKKYPLSPRNVDLMKSMDSVQPMTVADVVEFQDKQKERPQQGYDNLPEYTQEENRSPVQSSDMTPSDIQAGMFERGETPTNFDEDKMTGEMKARKELIEKLSSQLLGNIDENKSTADLMKKEAINALYEPSDYNLAPAFNMVSRLHGTGEQFGRGYVPPTSPEDQRVKAMQLLKAASDEGQGITKDQQSLLQHLLQGDTSLQGIMARMEAAKLANEAKLRGQDLTDAQRAAAQDLNERKLKETERFHNLTNATNKEKIAALAKMGGYRADRLTLAQQNQLMKAASTPEVKTFKLQADRLDNILKVADSTEPTYQTVHDMMQAFRRAMVQSGNSIGAERADTYFQSLPWTVKNKMQMVGGKPEYINKKDPMYLYIRNLIKEERDIAQETYKDNYQSAIAPLTSTFESSPVMAGNLKATEEARFGKDKDKKSPPPGLTKEQFLEWKKNNP